MAALQWGHTAYLVLLTIVVSGCVWVAWRID